LEKKVFTKHEKPGNVKGIEGTPRPPPRQG